MLRILSSKIFREDLNDYSLPMIAFENFDDVKNGIDLNNGTYKFCLPVSVGDFPEVNVTACFSNNEEELRAFCEEQKSKFGRRAFIMSDFLVKDLEDICYSGTINVSSKKIGKDMFDTNTVVSVTYKNPIITYGTEGISPRDLPADVEAFYSRITDFDHTFPKVKTNNKRPLKDSMDILLQAYEAGLKLHDSSMVYDGSEYNEYALFYVDKNGRIKLYEVVGDDSFLGRAKNDRELISEELGLIKKMDDGDKIIRYVEAVDPNFENVDDKSSNKSLLKVRKDSH